MKYNFPIAIICATMFAFGASLLTVTAQQSVSDLLNLKSTHPEFVSAYLTPNKLQLEDAWNLLNSSSTLMFATTTIGIIDEPVDRFHPEFRGEVIGGKLFGLVNFGTLPQSAIFTGGSVHGNGVAGIIGANNILGSGGALSSTSPHMNGILSGVSRLPYVLEVRGRLKDTRTAFGTGSDIESLVSSGVRIINISQASRLSSFFNSPILDRQKDKISAYPNVLFIVAAGNDGEDINGIMKDISPAIYGNMPNVITVGSVGNTDLRSSFSSYGDEVSISAPGEDVYVPTVPFVLPLDFADYNPNFSGTSASAPLVTGVAGLIKAINPHLTPTEIKEILTNVANTDPIITDNDKPIGRRLNALKAVCDPTVLNCAPSPVHMGTIEGTIRLDTSIGGGVINGATVSLYNADTFAVVTTTHTDANGQYHLTASPGNYLLDASKFFPGPDITGLALGTQMFTLVQGQTQTQDVVLYISMLI